MLDTSRRLFWLSVIVSIPVWGTVAFAADPPSKPMARKEKEKQRATGDPLPGEREFNQCVKIPAHRRVKVSLKPQTALVDLVAWISSMTCKRFILADGLRGQKVTIISPTPITAREAYGAFISALDVMGLTVVRSGRYLKVVQSNWAIQAAVPLYKDGERRRLPASDAVVTQILQVRQAQVTQLLTVLSKMKSRSGDVTAYAPTNTLILTDNGANVRRMVKIVEQLDLPAGRAEIWVVRPRHADVTELKKLLAELFASERDKGAARARVRAPAGKTPGERSPVAGAWTPVKVLADPGSGALILVATEPVFRRMRAVIRTVDVESDGSRARAWVYHLKHGDAETLAQALSGVSGGQPTARGKQRKREAVQVPLFEGPVKISVDKSHNALLIVASTRDYLNLRRMIHELDRPRRQVFVEAYILEISIDRNRDIGLAYHGGGITKDGTTILGGLTQGTDFNSVLTNPIGLMGLAAVVQGPVIKGSGDALGLDNDVPLFGVVLQALQSDGNVNLLSSPHLLTTDNEKAEIQVGENIPLRSGTANIPPATGGDASNLNLLSSFVQPVQRQDVGIQLKLVPSIGDGDTIRLKLEQEVTKVKNEDFGGLGASMRQRKISTVVTVRDQQTVVIGGLIRDEERTTENKVPLLGDIPILGRLFRSEYKHKEKINLLVVLTPHIIRDRSDLRRIFRQKLRERQEFIRRYTAYKQRDTLHKVDFQHKRGLLAEINAFGAQVEREARLTAEASERSRDLDVVRVRVEPDPSTTKR